MSVFLNVEEAAAFLLISKATIYAWVHQRRIPFRKHGRKLVFSRADLSNWSEATAEKVKTQNGLKLLLGGKKCYNKGLKADSLTLEKKLKRVHRQSTLYDPFEEGESL